MRLNALSSSFGFSDCNQYGNEYVDKFPFMENISQSKLSEITCTRLPPSCIDDGIFLSTLA